MKTARPRTPIDALHRLPTAVYLLFFLGINTALSLPMLSAPMLAESDAYVRALKAWEPWAQGNFWHLDFTDSWLPLHALILRMSFLFPADILLAPRILTFVISSLGIPVFYFYVKNYFSRNHALLATLLFTLFPLRLVLGTQTMSEGIFLSLFLLVMAAINSARLTPRALIIALAGSSIMTGIRYDGWFLLPYIWLNLWTRLRSMRLRIGTITLTLITPLWYLLHAQRSTGDTLTFLRNKISIARLDPHPEYFNVMLSMEAITNSLTTVIPLLYLLPAAIGVFALCTPLMKLRPANEPLLLAYSRLLLPVYFPAALFFQVYLGTMEWLPERYFLITAILLIPYLPLGIQAIYTTNRSLGIALILLILASFPFYGSHRYTALTSGQFHPTNPNIVADLTELAAYIKAQPRPSYRYIRSEYLNESYVIALSYFLTDPEIIHGAALATPQTPLFLKTFPRDLIVEKPAPDVLLAGSEIQYENEFFIVLTRRAQHTTPPEPERPQ